MGIKNKQRVKGGIFLLSVLLIAAPFLVQKYSPLLYRTVSELPNQPAIPNQSQLETPRKIYETYRVHARNVYANPEITIPEQDRTARRIATKIGLESTHLDKWNLKVASLEGEKEAQQLRSQLAAKGFDSMISYDIKEKRHTVILAENVSRTKADSLKQKLQHQLGLNTILVPYFNKDLIS